MKEFIVVIKAEKGCIETMKLYSVSISGKKYYFYGEISPSIIGMIEDYCRSHNNDESVHDPETAFSELYRYVRYKLQCSISPVSIEHVFRINRRSKS